MCFGKHAYTDNHYTHCDPLKNCVIIIGLSTYTCFPNDTDDCSSRVTNLQTELTRRQLEFCLTHYRVLGIIVFMIYHIILRFNRHAAIPLFV